MLLLFSAGTYSSGQVKGPFPVLDCATESAYSVKRLGQLQCSPALLIKPELCLIHFDSTLLLPVIFVTAGILLAG